MQVVATVVSAVVAAVVAYRLGRADGARAYRLGYLDGWKEGSDFVIARVRDMVSATKLEKAESTEWNRSRSNAPIAGKRSLS